MVTDAGTLRFVFAVETLATTLPGAGWFKVTVQVATPPRARLEGLQARAEIPTGIATAILPPVPVRGKDPPEDVAPRVLVTPIAMAVVTDGERVTATLATIPAGIVVELDPTRRHVY